MVHGLQTMQALNEQACYDEELYTEETMCNRISWMNRTFELPINNTPTDQGKLRLYEFESVLHEELSELKAARNAPDNSVERFVAVADLLGDLLVYTISEAARWGLPIIDIFHIIMDSQESKLVNGNPLKSPDNSKFIKGPNYKAPEPYIKNLINSMILQSSFDKASSMSTENMLTKE
jgi:hypothetical protein